MVRLDRPVLLTAVEIVLLLPIRTLPKLRLEALEMEELRTSCPATAIEDQKTLSNIALDQETFCGKPRHLLIVPPLMLVLAHGGGYGATVLRSGPPRMAGGSNSRKLQFPHVLFAPRDPIGAGRACGTTRWYIRQLVQNPERCVCYSVWVSIGGRKFRGLGKAFG
jgi:hypothetical protein